MSAALNEPATPRAGAFSRRALPMAVAISILLFGWAVSRFYEPDTGLTSMLFVGDKVEDAAIAQFRAVPHYIYNHSYGYDGAYYVQIALSPLLDEPALTDAVDNLSYRARRILISWTAWALGRGQPHLIVPVFPWLNVGAWFVLAALLLRLFPPNSWDAFLRWFAVLFSHGVCMSVSHALTDLPSLLLLAAGVLALERGRRGGAIAGLALASLTKETSVLAVTAFLRGAGEKPSWRRVVLSVMGVVLPLALWLAYLRWKLGPPPSAGMNNFALPFVGLAEKWIETSRTLLSGRATPLQWATAACVLALSVQTAFLLGRWRGRELWWRIGMPFALLALLLSRPVWEGLPGASTRVLLPMTLAFNVLVPAGRRWLPVLLAGNLSVVASIAELTPPPRFYQLDAPRELAASVDIKAVGGWYGVEQRGSSTWRWSSGAAGLQLRNRTLEPVTIELHGFLTARDANREIALVCGEQTLWSGSLTKPQTEFRATCTVPRGISLIQFTTSTPPRPPDPDQRQLAFSVSNLKISLRPPAPSP